MTRYTYYDTVQGKPGINRITWDDNGSENQNDWTEITREYMPVDPRTQPSAALAAVMTASPEEIQQIKQILGIV